MGLESHIQQLSDRHRRLEQTIDAEMAHPGHDALKVSAMKRQKLRIKEELERLRNDTAH